MYSRDSQHLAYRRGLPTVHLFSDVIMGLGGIETYLDALARRLHRDNWPVRVAVSLNGPSPFLDEIEALPVPVYRQPLVRGDRWQVRQRLLIRKLAANLEPGDWVYCVRQPMPEIYLPLVRAVHGRGGKLAASWSFAPKYLPPPPGKIGQRFVQAIRETDVVISVSECTKHQFREIYGYHGPVHVVRYHNVQLFDRPVPMPPGPPYMIAFIGRIDIHQKNLDTILDAFCSLAGRRSDIVLNFYGAGPDFGRLVKMVNARHLGNQIVVHGRYDHLRELPKIIANNHIFIYTSRFEGGPCFSLLELLQGGRFVVTSPVGGIPDIYQGRPEIGDLVSPNKVDSIADALEHAVRRVIDNAIDPNYIRSIYTENFCEHIAHKQWKMALGLNF